MADLVELRRLYAAYEGLIFNGPSGRLVDLGKRDKAILKLRELDAAIKEDDLKTLEAAVAERDAVIAQKDSEIVALREGSVTLEGGSR